MNMGCRSRSSKIRISSWYKTGYEINTAAAPAYSITADSVALTKYLPSTTNIVKIMNHINSHSFLTFDAHRVSSPCFVIDEVKIEQNLQILQNIEKKSGAKVLIALKAFSMKSMAPLICKYLTGCCASGVYEAKFAFDHFQGKQLGSNHREIHTYSPAFKDDDLEQLLLISDHIVFNSCRQWLRFKDRALQAQHARPALQFGLRINPMLSTGATELYDPCAKGSRLGITLDEFTLNFPSPDLLDGISGLHFHTLCEQGYDDLELTLTAFEQQFASYLPELQWLNLGGGHLITAPDYDRGTLVKTLKRLQHQYHLQAYIEPGEAIAINSGVLVAEVLDIVSNHTNIAIIDASATCHMPDTLEMPYRANVFTATANTPVEIAATCGDKPFSYRLGGQTCLAGDVMGDYSFKHPLAIGQRLMFDDMSHYTMVKTTTFNGMPLPSIAVWNSVTDNLEVVKQFHYHDFFSRLG